MKKKIAVLGTALTALTVAGAAAAALAATGPEKPSTTQVSLAAASANGPRTLNLVRYFGGVQHKHWVTTAPAPGGGYKKEGQFTILAQGGPNTKALYSCLNSYSILDQFVSADPGCESPKSVFLGKIGYIYVTPPKGIKTKPVYRCTIPGRTDHFVSHLANCERTPTSGPLIVEGRIGYVPA